MFSHYSLSFFPTESGGGKMVANAKAMVMNHGDECGLPCFASTTRQAIRASELRGFGFITVALAELVYLSGAVEYFVLAGIKWMTRRADLDRECFFGVSRTHRELVAATARNLSFPIRGVDIRFHW